MSVGAPTGRAALAGAVAVSMALATTVLVDGAWAAAPSLVLAVGQAVIRVAPGDAARAGIDTFGTADKPLVVAGVVVLSVVLGAAASVRGRGAFSAATWSAAAAGSLAAVAVLDAAWLPTLVAALLAALAGIGVQRVVQAAAIAGPPAAAASSVLTRRRFLATTTGAAGGAALVGVTGRTLLRVSAAEAARAAVVLPRPRSAAPGQPAAAALDVPGLTPLVTPNSSFYRIDEALLVPNVDLDDWRLTIAGRVGRPLTLTYDDLLARPLVERDITLACVSNDVGGPLIGNARWLGAPLAELLEEAGVEPTADQVVGRSVDGFTVGFPTGIALDGRDAMVAVGMNGEPLPRRHGFPARLVVPGLYGYVSATKWLARIELTTFDDFDAYWVRRGWARLAPIKVQSRIDVPRSGTTVAAGRRTIAGVAWAQQRGVAAVDVRIDDGPWQPAELGGELSSDTWRQWEVLWNATPGQHRIAVRATTDDGEVQDDTLRPPFPDGATGHHRVSVVVT